MLIAGKEKTMVLQKAYEEKESRLIAVIGRRRIGKTYLVKEVFEGNLFFSHAGLSEGKTDRFVFDFPFREGDSVTSSRRREEPGLTICLCLPSPVYIG